MENSFKIKLTFMLTIAHLIIILSLVILWMLGGYDFDQFIIMAGMIVPIFAEYVMAVSPFIKKKRYINKLNTDKKLISVFKFTSFVYPVTFAAIVLLAIWLKAFNLVFEDFSQFKIFILIMEIMLAGFAGKFIHDLFEKI
jgi:hypothetical protein